MRSMPALALFVALWGCTADNGDPESMGGMDHSAMATSLDTARLQTLAVPAELEQGAEHYGRACAACHGEVALGTAAGPPLVHIVYEPNHHGDMAFVLAAERGVRAHHWGFGDMPPVPGIQREEVLAIVQYIRWLQREAGVYR